MAIKLKAEELDIPLQIPGFMGILVDSPKFKKNETDGSNIPKLVGAAFGYDKENLLKRAASESIERYCGYKYKISDFIYDTYKNLKPRIADLKKLIGYSKDLKLEKWVKENNRKIHWVKCLDLISKEEKLLPACIVYPASNNKIFERYEKYNSSGLAAGNNLEMAVANAICELMERDSIMCSWFLKGEKMLRVPTEYIDTKSILDTVRFLSGENIQVSFFIIVNEFNLITVVTILKHKKQPYYSFGSSCKIDPKIAFERSLEEAIMIFRSQKILIKSNYSKKKVENLTDHIMSTSSIKSKIFIKSLEKKPIISYNQFRKYIHNGKFRNLEDLLNKIQLKQYSAYLVDITDPVIRDNDFVVVRVVIPGLHPLETNHSILHNDLSRIRKFSKNKNITEINNIPHPFG